MPRAGLSHDVVIAEAARVADEVGYEQLTLAAVAQRFGVAPPSLYKHVAGVEGVHRALAVLALGELAVAISAATDGRERGDALRAMADTYRGYAREHPGRYGATLRAPEAGHTDHVEASDAVLRAVFAVLAGYGIDGDDAVDATRMLRAALHGFVDLESRHGFGMPRDVDRSFGRLVSALDTVLRSWC